MRLWGVTRKRVNCSTDKCGCRKFLCIAALSVGLGFATPSEATDELRAPDISVTPLEHSFTIPVSIANQKEIAGVTVVIEYDDSVFTVTGASFDEAPSPGPEWHDFVEGEGWAAFAWILDLAPPYDGPTLPAGTTNDLGSFTCELVAPAEPGTQTPIHFSNEGKRPGTDPEGPVLRNCYSTNDGSSDVFPSLVDGTFSVVFPSISIDNVEIDRTGLSLDITVTGKGFVPQTTLTLGEEAVPFTLVDSETIVIADYACSSFEEVTLRLCNGDDCVQAPVSCALPVAIDEVEVERDGLSLDITVTGEGFVPQTTLTLGGEAVPFTLVDSETIAIADYSCSSFDEATLRLCNGDDCAEAPVSCALPVTIESVEIDHDGLSLDITVTGEGFVPLTSVTLNGEAVPFTLLDANTIAVTDYECTATGDVTLSVCNGPDCDEASFTCGTLFLRGDPNTDQSIDIADAVFILAYLFKEGELSCLDAADGNDDGSVDIADAVRILGYLFGGTGPLPAPFPEPGVDPTQDELDCEEYPL